MLFRSAVTWGSGTAGVTGAVSAANSLVGSQANDQVGFGGITTLGNGNYVVSSNYWANGSATNAGAVTWGSGTAGVTGAVSPANSLVGSQANDSVGYGGITALGTNITLMGLVGVFVGYGAFRLVLALLERRGIRFRKLSPSRYGPRLHERIRREEPGRAVDRLLVAGLIEARSCERFSLLRDHVADAEQIGRAHV